MTMRSLPILVLAGLLSLAPRSEAVVLQFSANQLADRSGTPLSNGTLLQLVNLGADGVFNQIDVGDGSVNGLARWVSGDDSVIDLFFVEPESGQSESGSSRTSAFDLMHGTDLLVGRLTRSLGIEDGLVPTNTRFGVRWFPGLLSSNFSSITLAAGQHYGEFTRQAAEGAQHGGILWTWPAAGNNTFDSLLTTEANPVFGKDTPARGEATLTVVPEPASLTLAFLGAAGLFSLRRRRH